MKLSDIVILELAGAGNICAKYSPSTGNCTTGCKTIEISKGEKCPYTVGTMKKCPCYA